MTQCSGKSWNCLFLRQSCVCDYVKMWQLVEWPNILCDVCTWLVIYSTLLCSSMKMTLKCDGVSAQSLVAAGPVLTHHAVTRNSAETRTCWFICIMFTSTTEWIFWRILTKKTYVQFRNKLNGVHMNSYLPTRFWTSFCQALTFYQKDRSRSYANDTIVSRFFWLSWTSDLIWLMLTFSIFCHPKCFTPKERHI